MKDFFLTIDINRVVTFSKVLLSVGIGIFLACLVNNDLKGKCIRSYKRIRERQYERIEFDSQKRRAYDAMQDYLWKTGIKYRKGNDFSPFDYMVFRLLVGGIFGCTGLLLSPFLLIVGFLFGYTIVPFYYQQENKNDNEAMLPDIATMASTMAIQIKNGVFISKVIYECYRCVDHPRLKQALLELSIDIDNFASVSQAAMQFRKKFDNQYIDSFAKTLEQEQVTGESLDFFEDINASVEGINKAITRSEELKAERIKDFFLMLSFVAPVILLFYILFTMFSNSITLW